MYFWHRDALWEAATDSACFLCGFGQREHTGTASGQPCEAQVALEAWPKLQATIGPVKFPVTVARAKAHPTSHTTLRAHHAGAALKSSSLLTSALIEPLQRLQVRLHRRLLA